MQLHAVYDDNIIIVPTMKSDASESKSSVDMLTYRYTQQKICNVYTQFIFTKSKKMCVVELKNKLSLH